MKGCSDGKHNHLSRPLIMCKRNSRIHCPAFTRNNNLAGCIVIGYFHDSIDFLTYFFDRFPLYAQKRRHGSTSLWNRFMHETASFIYKSYRGLKIRYPCCEQSGVFPQAVS